jgi:hypothetical protein
MGLAEYPPIARQTFRGQWSVVFACQWAQTLSPNEVAYDKASALPRAILFVILESVNLKEKYALFRQNDCGQLRPTKSRYYPYSYLLQLIIVTLLDPWRLARQLYLRNSISAGYNCSPRKSLFLCLFVPLFWPCVCPRTLVCCTLIVREC